MLILRCLCLDGAACPLLGARFNKSCLSCEACVPCWPCLSQAHGEIRRNNNTGGSQVSSSGVSSRLVTNTVSQSSLDLDAPGLAGVLICTAWGRPAAGEFWLSCALPASTCPSGSAGSWALFDPAPWVPEPCAGGIVLLGCGRQQGSDTSVWRPPPARMASPTCPVGCTLQPFEIGPQFVAHFPLGALPILVTPGNWRLHCPSCDSAQFLC